MHEPLVVALQPGSQAVVSDSCMYGSPKTVVGSADGCPAIRT